MSAGNKSGVNWMRLKSQALNGSGLGKSGQAFEQQVAVAEQGEEQTFDDLLLADDGAAYSVS